jgi:hypothetical protein
LESILKFDILRGKLAYQAPQVSLSQLAQVMGQKIVRS